MNAPLTAKPGGAASALLYGYTFFHLNLCFSSIEEEQRDQVIARCYWPLLELASEHGIPLGIEATGFTLEEIEKRDPAWIARLKHLIGLGLVEFIGSGYAQAIGPLVPARVTMANLFHGSEVYRRLIGTTPTLALINEQAYSAGLVPLYREAGYRAILMDWDNCAPFHPDWPSDGRHRPARALGADGSALDIIWTDTIAFQKLQRLAHGDITETQYRDYVLSCIAEQPRTLAIYSNDAECFDFRPGRFKTEERLSGGEWKRIAGALGELKADPRISLGLPSIALAFSGEERATLSIETPENPIPVKKQRKYNITRWAVTGRNDLEINTLCWRIYADLDRRNVPVEANEWRTLCDLWASDYRTHITEKRWTAYRERLASAAAGIEPAPKPRKGHGHKPARKTILTCHERWIDVATATLEARLNTRRGLAIDRLTFAPGKSPLVGTILHGELDDISLAADWYTGNSVFEAPGQPKITDLEWCEPVCEIQEKTGLAIISARIDTPRGPILKTLTLGAQEPRIGVHLRFEWEDWGLGALRLGHLTLKPGVFEEDKLVCRTHNGGRDVENFHLKGRAIGHGHPVSFLVSSANALGMTEGWCEFTDGQHWVRVEIDKTVAALIGMIEHRPVRNGTFCQLMLSALEMDETRKPGAGNGAAREFAYTITGGIRP